MLDAAAAVFARFGYRKTSMDEVARAAGVSRQGLYLNFVNKEDLFRALAQHELSKRLSSATAALADEGRPIETRLVSALDEWTGHYVGMMGADASDLIETSATLVGPMLAQHEKHFEQAIADAIAASGLMAVYAAADLSPLQLARTLHVTARGFKHSCTLRKTFVEGISIAVRVMFAPLRRSSRRR